MLTFVPHKIKEDYRKVEFFRVNKELCNNEIYKDLSPTAILLYSLLCDRFKQLNKANLIREKRQGNNKPNRIYVGKTISEINKDFINVKSENQTSGSPLSVVRKLGNQMQIKIIDLIQRINITHFIIMKVEIILIWICRNYMQICN